jgi:hypothetical protein
MTLDPIIVANMTQMPKATPLSGAAAERWNTLGIAVDACPDYSASRRDQMKQHIKWLIDPSDLPREMIFALGTNPTGKLIFGMATYTASEWQLKKKPSASCLLTIGRELNQLLIEAGEKPFAVFETSATPSAP